MPEAPVEPQQSMEETSHPRADEGAQRCRGSRAPRGAEGPDQHPLTGPGPRPKRPARRATRAPEGTGPRGQPAGGSPVPCSAGQACIAKPGPNRPPARPRPSGSTGLAAPPKAEVSPERRHEGRGHPPKIRKSPQGPVSPSPPLRSGH